MKLNSIKTSFILFPAMVIMLLMSSCNSGISPQSDQPETSVSSAQEVVKIEIKTPSAAELTIAPGRSFKVSGTLSGEIPEDAVLRVALLDAAGQEMRCAAADRKGTDRVIPSIVGGEITVFNKETDFSEVAYTAPEFVVADTKDPDASSHDATVKCIYTDQEFYALIVSATDPEHGLAEADGYELVDHDGRPYDALAEGRYVIQVELCSADGKELASTSEEIEIGRTAGTVIHEITNKTVIQKGGKELLAAWAADENLTVLGDLLPGFFGTHYEMSTMPMSVSCETAEYLPGEIDMLIYGNKSTSTSYALEVARYLQMEHTVENPEIAKYYAFDLGEPSFTGEQAKIVKLGDDESVRICRIDLVQDGTQDGVFLTTEEQVLGSDTESSDGWAATEDTFAIAGVMKPYQLEDDELMPDNDIYGYYQYLNGADTLVYTFTSDDGSDTFSITKNVGVSRIDEPDGESEPALYEFYNVFPAHTLKAGNSYDVKIQAYDRNNIAIKGMEATFTLSCQ